MANKAKVTYPDGYKRSDVSLYKTDDATGYRHIYMKDGTVWYQDGEGAFALVPDEKDEDGKVVTEIIDEAKNSADNNTLLKEAAAALEAQNAKIAELEAKLAGKPARTMEDVTTHRGPMAGKYPHKTDDMPTVDELNAAGQT